MMIKWTAALLILLPVVAAATTLEEYLKTGDLYDHLVCRAYLDLHHPKPSGATLQVGQDAVQTRLLSEARAVDNLLQLVMGVPFDQAPWDQETRSDNGYIFYRTDYIGRHVVSIRRDRDKFYWTIGVQYEGDFWKQKNKVRITGYYHVGTNGNLEDLTEALVATARFFPAPQKPTKKD